MLSRPGLFSILLLGLMLLAAAAGKPATTDARAAVIAAPMPEYPYEARGRYIQGQGEFVLHFDGKTGRVIDVTTTRSTGHAVLDEAAISALRRWQVKPGSFATIRVPVNFALDGLRATVVREATEQRANGNILYAPWPKFPLSSVWEGAPGKGRFQLTIDPRTGQVTTVKILESTRDNRLDAAAIKALRQWRFKPNTLRQFVVPIDFDLGYG
jgi:TonB family protein